MERTCASHTRRDAASDCAPDAEQGISPPFLPTTSHWRWGRLDFPKPAHHIQQFKCLKVCCFSCESCKHVAQSAVDLMCGRVDLRAVSTWCCAHASPNHRLPVQRLAFQSLSTFLRNTSRCALPSLFTMTCRSGMKTLDGTWTRWSWALLFTCSILC